MNKTQEKREEILIGEKLLSHHLVVIMETHWDKSFKADSITFNFNNTEWVSNSEMLFIIGWISSLKELEKGVEILLPSNKNLSSTHYKYKKRRDFQIRLLFDWNIEKVARGEIKIVNHGFNTNDVTRTSINEVIKIPIKKYDTKTFDQTYYQLYDNNNLGIYKNYKSLLEKAGLTFLESDFLNYSIVKELYSNSCLHSGLSDKQSCYYSISINRKISKKKATKFNLDKRKDELSRLEKDFFTTNENYRNIDFIEINFQDFGQGISKRLKEKYDRDLQNLPLYFGDDYELHSTQNLDSKVLHYALLLFTSSYEIDKKFEIHDYIPRGLFVIKELTEKYHGYLEIFSGEGAVTISYKDGNPKLNFAKETSKRRIFQGTRIRVVLPSQENIEKSIRETKTHKKNAVNDEINYIHLLSVFANVETELIESGEGKESSVEAHIMKMSLFFQEISESIILKPKGSVIIFDFSGFNKEYDDIFSKFIFFISHTPSNSNYRIVLFNITIKGLNDTFIFDKKVVGDKKIYPYPIPVIYPDINVEWLGIEDKVLAKSLDKHWKSQDDLFEEYDESYLKYISSILSFEEIKEPYQVEIEGEIHQRFHRRWKINILLPKFDDILKDINSHVSELILEEVKNNVLSFHMLKDDSHDYNILLREEEDIVFHNSYGNYQNSYLTFNDKLYIPSYRSMISTYFFFRDYYNFTDLHPNIPLEKADKLLSVTLSSQFLAYEVSKLFKEFFDRNVEIIALSNYYNFHNEKRFKDIKRGDKIVVINDIVSTGKLTENIFNSLEKVNSIPVCCLSIMDMRSDIDSVFDYPIISLSSYHIQRFSEKPDNKDIQWINPILNSPVTIKKEKNQLTALLEKEEFLNNIDEDDILIGNMKNNSYGLVYYFDTKSFLFKDKINNFFFLKSILKRLKEKKAEFNNYDLDNLKRGLEIIKPNLFDSANGIHVDNALVELNKIKAIDQLNRYKIDLVFYPFLSNINVVEENLSVFEDIVDNYESPLIFPIPRIQTEKGWRFTFPPKFLNILTKKINPSVLILDDGSCTGNTIMQLIDSAAFLSIESIDVLSIFGRLEDYQKELFSRLKSIKVKNKVVPINIFFGTHFNLPVHYESENPFLIEANEAYELKSNFKRYLSDNFLEYIEELYQYLNTVSYPSELGVSFPYFYEVSKKDMVLFRDRIGLFDAYRFYSEDIPDDGDFKYFINSEKNILTLLSVLNLEPNLYKTIKRLLSPIDIETIREHILKFLSIHTYSDSYEKQTFFIKALSYINPKLFINGESLIKLSKLAKDQNFSKKSYQFLNYTLLLIGFGIRSIEDVLATKGYRSNILIWLFEIKEKDESLYEKEYRSFAEAYRSYYSDVLGVKKKNKNSYNELSNYYLKTLNNEGRHDDRLLTDPLSRFETAVVNYKLAIKEGNVDNGVINEFTNQLAKFKNIYNYDYPEFSLIKEIIENLQNYGGVDLPFNTKRLYESIVDFERLIGINIYNLNLLDELQTQIRSYQNEFLFSSSNFFGFILNQVCNLQEVWTQCEKRFSDENKSHIPIKILSSLDYNVLVNKYVMSLLFANLIKNKNEWAEKADWSINTKYLENDRIDVTIEQNAPFVDEGGDGVTTSMIRALLIDNGTDYQLFSKKPYIIKLKFPITK